VITLFVQGELLTTLQSCAVIATTTGTIRLQSAASAPAALSTAAKATLSAAAATPTSYLPPALGSPLDLAADFSDYGTWAVVHDAYSRPLPGVPTSHTRWLLQQLGAHDLWPLVPREVRLTGRSSLQHSPWGKLDLPLFETTSSPHKKAGPGEQQQGAAPSKFKGDAWVVTDTTCPDLEAVLRKLVVDR
jgi:hypothetical protein